MLKADKFHSLLETPSVVRIENNFTDPIIVCSRVGCDFTAKLLDNG